jgi:hypothetical protein
LKKKAPGGVNVEASSVNFDMNSKNQYSPKNDRAAQEALRDEANKPEPLYNKTDRSFQRTEDEDVNDKETTGRQAGTKGSASKEEKDII